MKIGNIEFGPHPLFLAPMEDVTDIGFRHLCKRYGAAMVYTEFVSAPSTPRCASLPSATRSVLWAYRFTVATSTRWWRRLASWSRQSLTL